MVRSVTRGEALARIVQLAREHAGETIFVGIDGPGAAGKSTFAGEVAHAVPDAGIVEVDDFSGPSVSEWDWRRFEAEVVEPLVAGRPARYRAWSWDADAPGAWRELLPGRLILVEGVSATRREVSIAWALTVWVDAPATLRLRRARERDGEAMLATWREVWIPSEQAYIERERPAERVDLVIDGH
jgi:uridine kinase